MGGSGCGSGGGVVDIGLGVIRGLIWIVRVWMLELVVETALVTGWAAVIV